MQIILEPTKDRIEARKASFLEALSYLIYQSVVEYIQKQ
jgi:hypothetical protein